MPDPQIVVNVDCAFRGDPGYDLEMARVRLAGAELRLVPARTEEEIGQACREASIVLLEYPTTPITSRVLRNLPHCRALVKYGIGVDNIDLAAAASEGIVVANAAGFCSEEASDHTIALLLAASRRIVSMDRRIRAGGWFDFPAYGSIRRLRSLTLGLLGFGSISQAVARKISGFGMQVLAHDPYSPALASSRDVRSVGFDELIEASDLLSLHVPATAQTQRIIGEKQLRAMKPSAILINTSRGAVVDQPALVRALQEHWIAGAALDVFEQEPLPADDPMIGLENVVLTPHYAGQSEESMVDLRRIVIDSIEAVLAGYWPPHPVDAKIQPRVPLRPWAEFAAETKAK